MASCIADFLGTGNYLAPGGRYWNSFVLDRSILVEPSPIALPHLAKVGLGPADIDVVVLSHFHADHTFGWPFLLLGLINDHRGSRPLHVVGPAGVEDYLEQMLLLGGVPNVLEAAQATLDVVFVEIDGTWQEAGPLRFVGIEVDHVPHLTCYGFLFDRGGKRVGYSGDTRPCDGLEQIAAGSDVLVLECNGPHPHGAEVTHLDNEAVVALRRRHPDPTFVLTHLGAEPDLTDLPNTVVPADLESVVLL